ncbi:MAG: hypothetical protein KDI30_06640, partial [Pseudomonadales bacterium]|nr:hypothetical protein [Pseudomonadales bacterium]
DGFTLKRAKRKDERTTYDHWERSKNQLLDDANMPQRDEILGDYFYSATSFYKRIIYGSVRGYLSTPNPESGDRLDAFQLRHISPVDYKLANTPTEWAADKINRRVMHLLYGFSETAKILEEKDLEVNGSSYSRSPNGNRKSRGSAFRNNKKLYNKEATSTPHNNFSGHETEEENLPLSEDKQKAYDDFKGLFEDRPTDLAGDIASRMPKSVKHRVMSLAKNILLADTEDTLLRDNRTTKRILRQIIRVTHPDVNDNPTDHEVCSHLGSVLNSYRKTPVDTKA